MAYDDWVWIDRVTEINGDAVTYDAIGNPTTIGDVSLMWQGRNMTQYANDTNVYNYVYDMSGRRTTKSINGTQTKNYYEGNTLAAQQTGSDKLTFMFDANGAAYGFFYGNNPYFYIRNLQGDIVGITDPFGNVIGTYVYNAWGNLIESASDLSDPIAQLNPLRYRSYYYDTETGYYFLNSRYYNPKTGRFLNADIYAKTGQGLIGNNMFAYCNNNPVSFYDPSGSLVGWLLFGVVVLAGISGAILGYCADEKLTDSIKSEDELDEIIELPPPTLTQQTTSSNGITNGIIFDTNTDNTSTTKLQTSPTELTTFDRVLNAGIGLGLGLTTAGVALSLIGVGMAVSASPLSFVLIGQQIAAVGILAIDLPAMLVFPAVGIAAETIEWAEKS